MFKIKWQKHVPENEEATVKQENWTKEVFVSQNFLLDEVVHSFRLLRKNWTDVLTTKWFVGRQMFNRRSCTSWMVRDEVAYTDRQNKTFHLMKIVIKNLETARKQYYASVFLLSGFPSPLLVVSSNERNKRKSFPPSIEFIFYWNLPAFAWRSWVDCGFFFKFRNGFVDVLLFFFVWRQNECQFVSCAFIIHIRINIYMFSRCLSCVARCRKSSTWLFVSTFRSIHRGNQCVPVRTVRFNYMKLKLWRWQNNNAHDLMDYLESFGSCTHVPENSMF